MPTAHLLPFASAYRASIPRQHTSPAYGASIRGQHTAPAYGASIRGQHTAPAYRASIPRQHTAPAYRASISRASILHASIPRASIPRQHTPQWNRSGGRGQLHGGRRDAPASMRRKFSVGFSRSAHTRGKPRCVVSNCGGDDEEDSWRTSLGLACSLHIIHI